MTTSKGRSRNAWRALGLVLLIVGCVLAGWLLPIREWLATFLEIVRSWGVWGLVAIAVAYVPACLLLLPGWILSVGAGSLYGLVPGVIAISLGSTAGASAAFWAGRTIARKWVAERFAQSPRFASLDRAVAENGFLIVLLTRLSPAFPFNLLNYAFGLTNVRFRDYLLASWIGMLPGTVLYVFLGSTAASLAEVWTGRRSRTPAEWTFLIVGLVATLVVTIVLTRIARHALRERLPTDATR